MKLITWNVNSIRTRLDRLLCLLERHDPDLVCLQETKTRDETFPSEQIKAAGYHAVTWGQKTYNGVAILAKDPPAETKQSFTQNPVESEARILSADLLGTRIICAYIINGKSVSDPAYQKKLGWLTALKDWIASEHDPQQPLILTGDFNIAPTDADTWDADYWRDRIFCTEAERAWIVGLSAWGLTDLHASYMERHPPADTKERFSWWDYRAGAFPRNHGLRIDLILATAPLAKRCTKVFVDRDERKESSGPGKPSDHAPVIALFD